MRYRPEIDGLRAVAVVPVILFHADVPGFGGGFIGVDVFFVVSGYLITTICHSEMGAGQFSFLRFYERRARRILPALFLVMAATIPFAWLWLLPMDMVSLSKSLIAVSWFSSNFLFWKESGYFDAATPLKPLLHTWSLAIEEQFYVIFPLLLFWAERRRKAILPALAMVTVVSLTLAQIVSPRHQSEAFYLLHTRAWELAIGAMLAIGQKRITAFFETRPALQATVSASGLLFIVAAVFLLNGELPYPSFYTLLPTAGAAMFLATASQRDFAGRLLSRKPFVLTGMVSYSAYLWHQPIFALARQQGYEEPGLATFALLILLTGVLAILSWRFVEKPFRETRNRPTPIFVFALAGIVGFTCFGALGIERAGFASRLAKNVEWESIGQKVHTIGDVCDLAKAEGYAGVRVCTFGDAAAKTTVALYGDSHAEALSYELDRTFRQHHVRGIRLAAEACEPIPRSSPHPTIAGIDACLQNFQHLTDYVRTEHVDGVIVAMRWTARLFPVAGEVYSYAFNNLEGGEEIEDYREYSVLTEDGRSFSQQPGPKRAAVRMLTDSMIATGKTIMLVYPIPELGWNIAKLNMRTHGTLDTLTTSYQVYRDRQRFLVDILDGIPDAPNLRRIRTDELFCSKQTGRCLGQKDRIPLYYDDDHVSSAGADLIIGAIMPDVLRMRTSKP
jgi:peptidoglycan/LPS O-acetylase OafA/YrhL